MSVVDLTGKKIETRADERGPKLLTALKRIVDRLEREEMTAEVFYLIVDGGDVGCSMDSGLTADEAISMLEREKFRILCMLDGVKL